MEFTSCMHACIILAILFWWGCQWHVVMLVGQCDCMCMCGTFRKHLQWVANLARCLWTHGCTYTLQNTSTDWGGRCWSDLIINLQHLKDYHKYYNKMFWLRKISSRNQFQKSKRCRNGCMAVASWLTKFELKRNDITSWQSAQTRITTYIVVNGYASYNHLYT